jgi:hypothetical protein
VPNPALISFLSRLLKQLRQDQLLQDQLQRLCCNFLPCSLSSLMFFLAGFLFAYFLFAYFLFSYFLSSNFLFTCFLFAVDPTCRAIFSCHAVQFLSETFCVGGGKFSCNPKLHPCWERTLAHNLKKNQRYRNERGFGCTSDFLFWPNDAKKLPVVLSHRRE